MSNKKPLPGKGVAPKKRGNPKAPGIAPKKSRINWGPVKAGRPSTYSDDTAATICQLIADGSDLTTICDRPDMPVQRTVFRWLADYEDKKKDVFRHFYAQAREAWMQRMADGLRQKAAGAIGLDAAGVAAVKLQVDTDKWLLSKLSPSKYGDKVTQVHEGGGRPVEVEVAVVDELRTKLGRLYQAPDASA